MKSVSDAPARVLDCGSGAFPYGPHNGEEVVTVDQRPETAPTVVHDLSQFPWPFEADSFDLIRASHLLEHLPDVVAFMDEAYRILKPGGRLIVRVPHYTSRSAWCDPTHVRAFAAYWPTYFSAGNHDRYGHCQFRVLQTRLVWTREQFAAGRGWFVARVLNPAISRLASRNPRLCERTWAYLVGGFSEIVTVMQAVKDQRPVGPSARQRRDASAN
jgi:SAM-dependent methyltransferase